jgi:O-methyltransferase
VSGDVLSLRNRLAETNPRVVQVVDRVLAERLSFASEGPLLELAESVLEVERARLPGGLVEAGCALGGSALVIAAAKSSSRPLYLYDVFGMIPLPRLRDGLRAWYFTLLNRLGLRRGHGGDPYYGYVENLLGRILTTFKAFGLDPERELVIPIKGPYRATLRDPVPFSVALGHIDCDWYESVRCCLRALEPQLISGGRLIFDDYYSFVGCRDAVDDYFSGAGRQRYDFVGAPTRLRLQVVKRPAG